MNFRPFAAVALGLFLACSLINAARAGEKAWPTNYEAALKEAKASNRPILANFTGSDWCGWCIRLDKETFSQEKFQTFARDNVVLLEVDFPQAKEQSAELRRQNESLKEKFGVEGFPTLLLIDGEGKEIGRQVGYLQGGPDAMAAWIQEAREKR